MPIEIKELIIRAFTENSDYSAKSKGTSRQNHKKENKKLQTMVEEMFNQMKNKKDR